MYFLKEYKKDVKHFKVSCLINLLNFIFNVAPLSKELRMEYRKV